VSRPPVRPPLAQARHLSRPRVFLCGEFSLATAPQAPATRSRRRFRRGCLRWLLSRARRARGSRRSGPWVRVKRRGKLQELRARLCNGRGQAYGAAPRSSSAGSPPPCNAVSVVASLRAVCARSRLPTFSTSSLAAVRALLVVEERVGAGLDEGAVAASSQPLPFAGSEMKTSLFGIRV